MRTMQVPTYYACIFWISNSSRILLETRCVSSVRSRVRCMPLLSDRWPAGRNLLAEPGSLLFQLVYKGTYILHPYPHYMPGEQSRISWRGVRHLACTRVGLLCSSNMARATSSATVGHVSTFIHDLEWPTIQIKLLPLATNGKLSPTQQHNAASSIGLNLLSWESKK